MSRTWNANTWHANDKNLVKINVPGNSDPSGHYHKISLWCKHNSIDSFMYSVDYSDENNTRQEWCVQDADHRLIFTLRWA